MREHWRGALALAILHLILAIAFATITPWLTPGVCQGKYLPDIGAPDEAAHLLYVGRIGSGELPVLRPDRPAEYESHQPPLAYIAMAAVSPHPGRDFSGLIARLPNALFGALTVLAVFFLARALGRPDPEPLIAAAIVALLPMQIALDGAASNDPLLILLCTAALIPIAKGLRPKPLPRHSGDEGEVGEGAAGTAERDAKISISGVRAALAFGLLATAAAYTKTTGLLLLPVGFLALAQTRPKPGIWAMALALPILAFLPWAIRNQTLYGDPLALAAFKSQFPPEVGLGSKTPLLSWLHNLVPGTAKSAIGMFGYMDIQFPAWIYAIAGCLLFPAILIGLFRARVGAAILLFVALVFAAFVAFNLSYFQPQARYLFPALGPLAVGTAAGTKRFRYWPAALLAILAVATIYALATLPGAFHERIQAGAQTK